MMSERQNPRTGQLVGGLFVIVVGILILLRNQGIIYIHDLWRFWPVIFYVIGISKLVERRPAEKVVTVGVMFLLGTGFLLINFGYVTWGGIWPLGLIGFGGLLLWQALRPAEQVKFVGSGQWSAVFSSVEKTVDGDYADAEANSVFGSVDLDLSHAKMPSERAYLKVNVVFGSAEIRIPESWKVDMRASAVMGSCEDRTRPPISGDGVKTLVLTGDVVFGSLEIRN